MKSYHEWYNNWCHGRDLGGSSLYESMQEAYAAGRASRDTESMDLVAAGEYFRTHDLGMTIHVPTWDEHAATLAAYETKKLPENLASESEPQKPAGQNSELKGD